MKTGDRITVEAERVGQPAREGQILEVVEGGLSVSYRVRWDDGHESLFIPAAGAAVNVVQAEPRKTRSKG